jgi:hypothetical protein
LYNGPLVVVRDARILPTFTPLAGGAEIRVEALIRSDLNCDQLETVGRLERLHNDLFAARAIDAIDLRAIEEAELALFPPERVTWHLSHVERRRASAP